MALVLKEVYAFDKVLFVNVSDPHLAVAEKGGTFKITEGSRKVLEDTINELNRMKDLDFITMTGDLLNDGEPWNLNNMQEILLDLRVPYYLVLGNHDYAHPGKPGISKAAFIFSFQGHGFQGNYGWYSLDPAPGLHAVFLDSTMSNSHGGHIPKIELDWLDKDLYENRDKLTIIFLHHLLVPAHPFAETGKWKRIIMVDNADKVRALLKKYPQVQFVISGHHHLGRVKTVEGIHYFMNHSIVTYPNRYTVYELTTTKLKYWTVDISDKEIIALSKKKALEKGNPFFKIPGIFSEEAGAEEALLKMERKRPC
jgi:3',5'-cyclic AMP phosphodiesterase CpdA